MIRDSFFTENDRAKEALKNRETLIVSMLREGISFVNICRFYQINLSTVRKCLRDAGETELEEEIDEDKNDTFSEKILPWRDEVLNAPKTKKAKDKKLAKLGFFFLPDPLGGLEEQIEAHLGKESENKVYAAAWEYGKEHRKVPSKEEIAEVLGIDRRMVYAECRREQLDLGTIARRGRDYGLLMEHLELLEFSGYHCKPEDLKALFGIEKEDAISLLTKLNALLEFYGITLDKKDRRKEIEEAVAAGACQNDLAHLTGLSTQVIHRIRVSLAEEGKLFSSTKRDESFDFKTEQRRENIFRLYNVEKMTQQEIADKLGLTRATVLHDIKKYEVDHPDEVDPSILWQQRNTAKAARRKKERVKKAILLAAETGKTTTDISREEKVGFETVKRYKREMGLASTGENKADDEFLVKQKESRLKKARRAADFPPYRGHGPTTTIMEETGLTREQILSMQRETAGIIKAGKSLESQETDLEDLKRRLYERQMRQIAAEELTME